MIPTLLLRLLLHAGAIALAWVLPRWQARDDNRRIREDGAKNSLKDVFHRQRLTLRVLLLVGAGLLSWAPLYLAGHHDFAVWGLATYLAAGLANFGYQFNTRLNRARKLPEWKVSRSKTTARFDRNLVRLSAYLTEKLGWRATPEQLLQRAMIVGLLVTVPVYTFTFLASLTK